MLKSIQKIYQYFKDNTRIGVAILLAAALVLPFLINNRYIIHLLIISCIWGITTVSLNILVGYRGMLCLANSAFMGIGAYTSALLVLRAGISFWIAMVAAMIVAGLIGLFSGVLVARLPVTSLISSTLALRTIVQVTANNWTNLTNGPMGISGIPTPSISLLKIASFNRTAYYYFAVFALCIVVLITYRIVNSPFGRAWLAMKDNVDLARSLGINQYGFDVIAFAIVGILTGLGGCLYAHYIKVVAPEIIAFPYMALMTTIVVAGGRGTTVGPLVGALIFTMLPEVLRALSEMRQILYGVSIMVIILYFPGGVASIPQYIREKYFYKTVDTD